MQHSDGDDHGSADRAWKRSYTDRMTALRCLTYSVERNFHENGHGGFDAEELEAIKEIKPCYFCAAEQEFQQQT